MENMNIRLFACLLCALLAGCASRTDPNDPRLPRELVPDPTFAGWFHIRGLGVPDDDGAVQGVFRSSGKVGKPAWTLAQWASRHNLADPAASRQLQLDADRFAITNASKRVVVNSRTGEIELGLFASACYGHARRAGESWPHLLASVPLTDTRYASEACRVTGMKRLDVSFSCRLDTFADRQPKADPKLHAAQFQLFLYVQNLKQGDDGFGDMMWFGIPVFDNRFPVKEEHYQRDGGKADASGKFIYGLSSKVCLADSEGFVRNNRLLAGKDARWVDFRANVAPWIVYAYKLARKNGFLATTELQDLYVSGLNFGWEMPGAYDASMRLRDLSLVSTPYPPAPLSAPPPNAPADKDARPPKASPPKPGK